MYLLEGERCLKLRTYEEDKLSIKTKSKMRELQSTFSESLIKKNRLNSTSSSKEKTSQTPSNLMSSKYFPKNDFFCDDSTSLWNTDKKKLILEKSIFFRAERSSDLNRNNLFVKVRI